VKPSSAPDGARDAELPLLVGGDRCELALLDPIGRGGMALVVAARQIPLAREVAVKRAVVGGQDGRAARADLIREARVTGSLEHPNIVPIHALGVDEHGEVLLVMKRIEGTSWAELLRARMATTDDLDRHLEILMEVSITAHFAHSRRVIHRDLKPGNVMVGSFGEVYVLDWGLAISLDERGTAGVAGTPQYMAPEMAVPDGRLDARSDVYLLGAILHEILTGHPPHDGASVAEVLHRAHLAAPPTLPDDIPGELAAICRRALARDPAARFASAEQLRGAIADFRRHASARALCAQAGVHLQELERLVAARSADDLAAHDAFSAARFGFAAATSEWPQSDDARAGIADTVHAMARFELDRRHLDAAVVLVNQLPAERAAGLAEGLARLRRDLAREAELRAQGVQAIDDADLVPNRRRRVALLLTASFAWTAYGVVTGVLMRAGIRTPGHVEQTAVCGGMTLLLLAMFPLFARQGRANRTFFETALAMLVGVTCIALIAWRVDMPITAALATAQLLAATVTWAGMTYLDRSALAGPVIMFLGTPAVLLLDRWAFDINGVIVGVSLGFIAWRWRW